MTHAPRLFPRAETITHISFWDAASGGNFLWSAAATVTKGGASGDIIRLASNAVAVAARELRHDHRIRLTSHATAG